MTVRMRHPEIKTYPPVFGDGGGYPEADEEQFELVWEPRGWVRVADDETDFAALKVSELQRLVEQAQAEGRDVKPEGRSKADLVAALEADRAESRAEPPEVFQGP